MKDQTSLERVERLKAESEATKVEAEVLAENFDDSTGLSWLWAFLFGPIYYAVHGFWGRALLIFVLNFMIIGFLISPFLAYPAWKKRAEKRAERMLTLDKIRRNS